MKAYSVIVDSVLASLRASGLRVVDVDGNDVSQAFAADVAANASMALDEEPEVRVFTWRPSDPPQETEMARATLREAGLL